jgi:hypothetical protein
MKHRLSAVASLTLYAALHLYCLFYCNRIVAGAVATVIVVTAVVMYRFGVNPFSLPFVNEAAKTAAAAAGVHTSWP